MVIAIFLSCGKKYVAIGYLSTNVYSQRPNAFFLNFKLLVLGYTSVRLLKIPTNVFGYILIKE